MTRWPSVPLRELLDQRTDEYRVSDPSAERYVTVRLYGRGAVQRDVGEGKTPNLRSGYKVVAGDLIYSRIDARNGAFALIPAELDGAIVSKDFPCFRVRADKVVPEFLARFLGSEPFYRQLRASSFGTTNRQRINESVFLGYRMPLPPMPDQKRLLALLDEADGLRELRREAVERLDALIPSVFASIFGYPEAPQPHRETRRLGDVCTFVSGGTPPTSNAEFWSGDIPWASPKDLKILELLDTEDHISAEGLAAARLRLLPADTVLIVVRGMILQHTFPVVMARVRMTINQDVRGIIPSGDLTSDYLFWFLRMMSGRILSRVSTSGHGTKRLEMDRLTDLQVPVPTATEQEQFAAQVAEVRSLRDTQAAHGLRLDAFAESLQTSAFLGAL